jgi:hypothetical protein
VCRVQQAPTRRMRMRLRCVRLARRARTLRLEVRCAQTVLSIQIRRYQVRRARPACVTSGSRDRTVACASAVDLERTRICLVVQCARLVSPALMPEKTQRRARRVRRARTLLVAKRHARCVRQVRTRARTAARDAELVRRALIPWQARLPVSFVRLALFPPLRAPHARHVRQATFLVPARVRPARLVHRVRFPISPARRRARSVLPAGILEPTPARARCRRPHCSRR